MCLSAVQLPQFVSGEEREKGEGEEEREGGGGEEYEK